METKVDGLSIYRVLYRRHYQLKMFLGAVLVLARTSEEAEEIATTSNFRAMNGYTHRTYVIKEKVFKKPEPQSLTDKAFGDGGFPEGLAMYKDYG